MMIRACIWATVAVAMVAAVGGEAKTLEPKGPWRLDYAEDKCMLARNFGEGDDALQFVLEQSGMQPFYNLALYGKPAKARQYGTMTLAFGEEKATERGYLSSRQKGDNPPFLLMFGVHLAPVPDDAEQGQFSVVEIGPEREAAIETISFKGGVVKPFSLNVGPMGEPLAQMRACGANLVETLQLDDASRERLLERAGVANKKELAKFIVERYPMKMLKDEVGGLVVARLMIDPEGEATSCQIAKSDRPAVFDDFVCFGLMRAGKFTPAIGPDGEPRYDYVQQAVRYVAP